MQTMGVRKKIEMKLYNTKQVVRSDYLKGQSLFVQGAPVFGMYYLITGKVKLSSMDNYGNEYIHMFKKSGDFLCYGMLTNASIHELTATPLEKCQVAFIDKKNFYLDFLSDQKVNMYLVEECTKQSMELIEKLNVTKQLKGKKKIIQFIKNVNKKFKKSQNEHGFFLTRKEWANYIGVAPETFIRFISELKKDNAVYQDGKALDVRSG